ncbi:MAG: LysR family transcriptional regulator [Edwardsiella sp. (in: enterobacteria)]|uniref:LysR family transcriptional regulator n=1 Tax=Edwardsiella piscicida TaxID=1263550 RepID=UPI00370D28E7
MPTRRQPIINLDLDLLRTYVAVADSHSFAAAAETVCRTQPAVSQQMQRLESIAGRPLFILQGRNKTLTEEGGWLLNYARRILRLNDEACLFLRREDIDGVLKIGSPDDTANTILPDLLARFSTAYPRLTMDIVVQRSPFLMRMLADNALDLAISTEECVGYPRITLRASPSLWFAGRRYQPDFSRPLPLVVLDEPSTYRSMMISHLERHGIRWRIAYMATTLSGARAAVRAGLGIMARSLELLGEDLGVLDERHGLPPLPAIRYNLYLNTVSPARAAHILFNTLQAELARADGAAGSA